MTWEKLLTLWRLVFSSKIVSLLSLSKVQNSALYTAGVICRLNEWLHPKQEELVNPRIPFNLGTYECYIGRASSKLPLFA